MNKKKLKVVPKQRIVSDRAMRSTDVHGQGKRKGSGLHMWLLNALRLFYF